MNDAALIASAGVALLAMSALGIAVSKRALTRLDVIAIPLRGRGTPLAVVFTRSGYWYELVAVALVAAAIEFTLRREITLVTALAVTQLLAQKSAQLLKVTFNRIRPDDWLYRKERGGSFPSGHAATAALFYGGLAALVWFLPLPVGVQAAACCALVVWAAGIAWSRMALAAHYATDVLGGLLLGLAWLGVMLVVVRHVYTSA